MDRPPLVEVARLSLPQLVNREYAKCDDVAGFLRVVLRMYPDAVLMEDAPEGVMRFGVVQEDHS